MKNNGRLVTLAAMILLLAMSGCSRVGEQNPPLAGTAWVLVELESTAPLQGSEITLVFEENNAGGSSGCNSYGGEYKSEADGKIQFGEIEQTLMFCMEPEGVMDQEMEYSRLLLEAASYRITDEQLEIENRNGQTILRYAQQ